MHPVNPADPVKDGLEDEALTRTVIGCAMKVHRTLGPGFLESVYENALAHELRKADVVFACQIPVRVFYDGVVVGDFDADLLAEGRVIVEIKAVRTLVQQHEVQLVNYLTATGLEIGLLLNFGAPSLEFKRKHRTYRERTTRQD
jgi:GxxExxY protein